jgi:hypothetical protein
MFLIKNHRNPRSHSICNSSAHPDCQAKLKLKVQIIFGFLKIRLIQASHHLLGTHPLIKLFVCDKAQFDGGFP